MEESNKRLYTFNGAVWLYKTLVASSCRAQTRASSEKKARANIAYQYKKANNLADYVKVTLEGKLSVAQ